VARSGEHAQSEQRKRQRGVRKASSHEHAALTLEKVEENVVVVARLIGKRFY